MGRGRQKAKATKQARDMKYFSPETDYAALQRELTGGSNRSGRTPAPIEADDYDDYKDKYSSEYEDEDDRRFG